MPEISEYDFNSIIADAIDQLNHQIISFLGGKTTVDLVKNVQVNTKSLCGIELDVNDPFVLYFYFRIKKTSAPVIIKLRREFCEFTTFEINFLEELIQGINALVSRSQPGSYKAHFRSAYIGSAFEIAISRHLREGPGNFANIQSLIQHLKRFSFMRYEGQACTIGFLYTKSAIKTFNHIISTKKYNLKKFKESEYVKIDSRFFESVLSYRYVDGIRSIYIINSELFIVGILELATDKAYSNIEMRNHTEFLPAFETDTSFGIFVNKKSEIDILMYNEYMLRWRKGKWSQVNIEIFEQIFGKFFIDDDEGTDFKLLIQLIISLSASDQGAIILLYDEATSWDIAQNKIISRHIDPIEGIAKQLRKHRLNKPMSELNKLGILASMLATDGMTVLSPFGIVLDCSALISLTGDKKGQGGGRAAAAKEASRYGIAIKISEDGPIQIYKGKDLHIEIT